ncbi:MAG TPA: hypothetical protein EYP04_11890 [Anaerolineae bacterium]|nr:hypothetical protein [Anaerolineae bacterium]
MHSAVAWLVLFLLFVGLVGLTGCRFSLRPLLYDVRVEPALISPNADGVDDVTHIFYGLGRHANVSIYFVDAAGTRYYFRKEQPRSPGRYDVYWGGVIKGETLYENEFTHAVVTDRVLPDGEYRWVIEATDDRGRTAQQSGVITLVDADTQVPELRNFSVTPQLFRPNQDGLRDDRVAISYFLNKDVEEIQVYLVDPKQPGVKYPIPEREREIEPGEAGYHYYDYEGGVDRGADPPPDGTYYVVGEARDAAGNRVMVTSTLTIVEGGKPRADIVNADIDWQGESDRSIFVPLGGTFCFTATVENYGRVPIRTSGPWPGTVYNLDENYNTLAARTGEDSWYIQAGVWRFGINFETTGIDFPFRFAVGRKQDLERRMIDGREQWYLLPGHRGLVTGCIHANVPLPRQNVMFWGGLIHEQVGINAENNYVDRVVVTVGVP